MTPEQKEYKTKCEELHPSNISDEAKTAAFLFAWEEGHACGLNDVLYYYGDIIDVAKLAAKGTPA